MADEKCPGCPGMNEPGCEHPMCVAMIRRSERKRSTQPCEPTLLQIIQGFLDCPEIADCAPEDKDPETEALESKARSILSRRPFPSGRAEEIMRAALERIAESRDAGRHDGLREECPLHDQYTMWLEAREALQLCASPSSPWRAMESAPEVAAVDRAHMKSVEIVSPSPSDEH